MAIDEIMKQVADALRREDGPNARQILARALMASPDRPELLNLAGILAARAGDTAQAVTHFGRYHRLYPDDPAGRTNLATALVADGQLDAAEVVIVDHEHETRLRRLLAQIAQLKGDLPRAVELYTAVVALTPADWEAWNNLGNARGALGDIDGGIEALRHAISQRPDARAPYLNLAILLGKAERHEQRVETIRAAAQRFSDDPAVLTELGRAEAALQGMSSASAAALHKAGAAEAAFEAAIAHDPRHVAAYVELAVLLENRNRLDALGDLVARAEAAGIGPGELAYIRAWHLRRAGHLEEALAFAEAAPETINPQRRAQLIGGLADRLGNIDKAFAAFTTMNDLARASRAPPPGPDYRTRIERDLVKWGDDLGTRWLPCRPESPRPDPVFIVGFPRSGTTLLDTMLGNAEELNVMEELPVLAHVLTHLSPDADLATMPPAEIERLRAIYFTEADRLSPARTGTRLVDKMPLHLTHAPLLHRLFPAGQFIFVERHPCDVVLSCFMQNFQLNLAMRSFTTLEESARTYDAVMRSWTYAMGQLPLQVAHVRYERMTAAPAEELRKATDFLGLPWRPGLADNRQAAAARDHIRTASYSQVGEPIYRRSVYRWQRYRRHLQPILPILAPWADGMGYGMDGPAESAAGS